MSMLGRAAHCRVVAITTKVAGLAAAVVVVAALAAASASAAVPFNAGTGHDAQVAVGADGTGHVVWLTDEAGDRVGYCRVPRAGGACDAASKLLSFPGGATAFSTGDVPQVFASAPNKVVVVGSCFSCGTGGSTDRIFRWISNDNGTTFGAPTGIANNLALGGQGAYVDADNVFVGVAGRELIAGPTSPVTEPIAPLPGGHVFSPSVVRVPGQNQLVAASNDLAAAAYTVFSGILTPTLINNVANWSGPQPPPGGPVDDDETALGAAGGGTFLVYKRFVPNDNRVIVHKYDPASRTFGAPAAIEGASVIDDSSADYTDVAVDSLGPQVIWRTLYDGGRLRYRRSTDGGATWGPVLNIALRDTFVDPEIAVAPGGSGFATWTGIGTSTVRVVALDPQPEPVPSPPPAPVSGSTPSASVPAVYSGTFRAVTVSDRTARFRLFVPRSCVAPGQKFKVRLKWKRKKRKGNLFVKVRRVDFYLNTKRIRIDKKTPFVHTYKLRASQAAGSSVRLRARAFIKVKRGKSPTKSIRTKVKVCG
jgi:hypothetical protein